MKYIKPTKFSYLPEFLMPLDILGPLRVRPLWQLTGGQKVYYWICGLADLCPVYGCEPDSD